MAYVKNNRKSSITIPLGDADAGSLVLEPGYNTVDDGVWAKAMGFEIHTANGRATNRSLGSYAQAYLDTNPPQLEIMARPPPKAKPEGKRQRSNGAEA